MELRLPKEILNWVDDNREDTPRQIFIIAVLDLLKHNPKKYKTEDFLNEVYIKTRRTKEN